MFGTLGSALLWLQSVVEVASVVVVVVVLAVVIVVVVVIVSGPAVASALCEDAR